MKPSFSRGRRLKNKEVRLLLENARKVRGQNFILYARGNSFSFYRLAVSVSRKFIKLSCQRNLLRRRIKACFLEAQREAVLGGGWDILIVLKTKKPLVYKVIKREIFDSLKKIK